MRLWGPTQATKLTLVRSTGDPKIDVVFVHGLGGEGHKTFRLDEQVSWHTWIGDAVDGVRIWTLDYRHKITMWAGGAMPLTDRSINVLATLQVELLDGLPIVIVGHSYGGLLAKQLLRSSQHASFYKTITDRIKGIVFLGTPHTGSNIAHYVAGMKIIVRSSSAVQELRQSEPLLRDLNAWFRDHMQTSEIKLTVYFETTSTKGIQIVDASSADPGIAGVVPVPVDGNHFEVAKPLLSDFRVKQTIEMIRSLRGEGVKEKQAGRLSLLQKMLVANDDELKKLGGTAKRKFAANPKDAEAEDALDYYENLNFQRTSSSGGMRATKGSILDMLLSRGMGAYDKPSLLSALFIISGLAVGFNIIDSRLLDSAMTDWLKRIVSTAWGWIVG